MPNLVVFGKMRNLHNFSQWLLIAAYHPSKQKILTINLKDYA